MLSHLASCIRKEKKKRKHATTSGETNATHHFRKKKNLLIGSRHPFYTDTPGCPLREVGIFQLCSGSGLPYMGEKITSLPYQKSIFVLHRHFRISTSGSWDFFIMFRKSTSVYGKWMENVFRKKLFPHS